MKTILKNPSLKLGILMFVMFSVQRAAGQSLKVIDEHISIDTLFATTKSKADAFNAVKIWMIQNVPDYKSLAQGEVAGELLSTKMVVKYWAAMGTKQQYLQDLNVTFADGQVKVKVDKLKTFVPGGGKGYEADKTFLDGAGRLKSSSMNTKWYRDVEAKFKSLSSDIATASR
jgi:hypothetical protein